MLTLNKAHREDTARVRGEIWDFSAQLKDIQGTT